MRTVKHRPISDFKLRMAAARPFDPRIGRYMVRREGWRQLFETDDGIDLIVDCWESLSEITASRWRFFFNNFDDLAKMAFEVIEPAIIEPDRFDAKDPLNKSGVPHCERSEAIQVSDYPADRRLPRRCAPRNDGLFRGSLTIW